MGGAILPFIFNTIVLGMKVRKTMSNAIEMRRMGRESITQLLFRDGMFAPQGQSAALTTSSY